MYRSRKTQITVDFGTVKPEMRALATLGRDRSTLFHAAAYARPANYLLTGMILQARNKTLCEGWEHDKRFKKKQIATFSSDNQNTGSSKNHISFNSETNAKIKEDKQQKHLMLAEKKKKTNAKLWNAGVLIFACFFLIAFHVPLFHFCFYVFLG